MKSQENIVSYYLELLNDNIRQGYFLSYSSPSKLFSRKVQKFPTTFSNALIMLNLMGIKSKNIELILNKLNVFLLNQKTKILTFNYWDKNANEYTKIPYPDDLDDTFIALTAIHRHNVRSLSGSDMRKITELLVHQEAETGGPYFTWVYNENDVEWKDIDVAVNSNIAFFLSELDITLPNIVNFIEKAILNKQIVSKYYPQSIPVGYFISKWYKGEQVDSLITFLETSYNSNQSTFLDKLLVAIALLNYEKVNHPIVLKIYKSLNRNPKIANRAYPFYRGVNPFNDGEKYYAGSPSLTISFALEFLHKYQEKLQEQNINKNEKNYLSEVNAKTFAEVKAEFIGIGGSVKKLGIERLNILEKNPDMALITSVPFITQRSLNKSKSRTHILEKLSIATLYGWLAYDIYDDFFDSEGSPPNLSVANFALRQLTDIFTSDHFNNDFRDFFHKTMNVVDEANAREALLDPIEIKNNTLSISEKLFEQLENLNKPYEKSYGHVLGILAVYFLNGYSLNSRISKETMIFFKHYLSARQLIDDMHDWEDDLTNGKLNLASAEMIKSLYLKNRKHITIDKLRLLFWESAVVTCCEKVNQHINQALKTNTPFSEIIKPFQEVLSTTLNERRKALEFLS
jgi:hypothetical protein